CIGVFSLLIGAGCGKKSEDETSGKTATASSSASTEVFVGKKAGLPGPLGALAFGMDEAGAKKALPSLFEDEVSTYGTSRVARGRLGDNFVSITFDFGKLSKVELSLKDGPAEKATKAWGEPERAEIGASKKKALFWVDTDAGIRAVLIPGYTEGEYDLQVSKYLSFEKFASLDDKARPLSANLVLGADPATLLKTFPSNVAVGEVSEATKKRTEAMMKGMKDEMAAMGVTVGDKKDRPDLDANLPPTRLGDGNTSVVLHFGDNGRVRSLTTNLAGNDATLLGKEVSGAFDKAWGPAKVLKSAIGDTHYWYDAKRGVRVSARLGGDFGVALEAVRYMPLATLFGDPGVKWGSDKGPIVGSTPDEIKAAYGDAFAPYKESGSLKYPTTDYDDNVATTNINFHMKDGKVSSYYFELDYGNYGPAQAEILAMFVAKFGEGKSDGKWVTYHDKDPKIRVRDSDITHSFDIEVE
ncbi:MAG: hypothetical protein JKY56_02180, partial [Kofleriaceae bacterium]|nr:hypothetical protein [Kofleriaceae bacterium]